MKNKKIIFLLFIAYNMCAQNFAPPVPHTNIDSLIVNTNAYKILYPRTFTETALRISCIIDSNGITEAIYVSKIFSDSLSIVDSAFIHEIQPELKKIKWTSAKSGNKSVNSVYTIPFILLLKNPNKYLELYHSGKTKTDFSRTYSGLGNANYSAPIFKVIAAPYKTNSWTN